MKVLFTYCFSLASSSWIIVSAVLERERERKDRLSPHVLALRYSTLQNATVYAAANSVHCVSVGSVRLALLCSLCFFPFFFLLGWGHVCVQPSAWVCAVSVIESESCRTKPSRASSSLSLLDDDV